jgi:hypothetical protein
MPHALNYDTLPPHSTLRREMVGDTITITAGPQQPGAPAKRAALHRAAFSGALICSVLLAAFVLAFGGTYLQHRRYIDSTLFVVLVAAFAIFCAALFGLIWRMQYTARIDALEHALRQTTVLAAAPGKLIIETAGPFGQASHELLGSVRDLRQVRCGNDGIDCLQIVLSDSRTIEVLPGRDAAELQWVARTLRATIRL